MDRYTPLILLLLGCSSVEPQVPALIETHALGIVADVFIVRYPLVHGVQCYAIYDNGISALVLREWSC